MIKEMWGDRGEISGRSREKRKKSIKELVILSGKEEDGNRGVTFLRYLAYFVLTNEAKVSQICPESPEAR